MHDIVATPIQPCKHLKAEVRPHDIFGYAWCEECQHLILLSIVFSNWLKEFRQIRRELSTKDRKMNAFELDITLEQLLAYFDGSEELEELDSALSSAQKALNDPKLDSALVLIRLVRE